MELIKLFAQLGKVCGQLGRGECWSDFSIGLSKEEYEKLEAVVNRQFVYNGWFTKENVAKALLDWSFLLTEEKMTEWLESYSFANKPKKVSVIMAGNIPLVGFHDFSSVMLSGNIAVCKLSSEDNTLLPAFLEVMVKWNPDFSSRFVLTSGKIGEVDAIIATGSNNSVLHFEQYFGHLPHVFRKNRVSVAVLDGSETEEQLELLGHDIFNYFGLGCRNVSHLLIPEDFLIDRFFEGVFVHKDIIYNKKYGNNYDYNKAIFLMNKHALLDNNFVLLKETEDLHSPLAMVYYHRYKNKEEVQSYLVAHQEDLQAVVGNQYIPFGQAQRPSWTDYADNLDTMAWLETV